MCTHVWCSSVLYPKSIHVFHTLNCQQYDVVPSTGPAAHLLVILFHCSGLSLYSTVIGDRVARICTSKYITVIEARVPNSALGLKRVLLPSPVQGPGDEPVWRQLMQLFLKDRNPDVVQQAAAALEH